MGGMSEMDLYCGQIYQAARLKAGFNWKKCGMYYLGFSQPGLVCEV